MQKRVHNSVLELVQGDITAQDVDAVVNAANSGLRGGGGVDGAIHRAGGPAIMDECRKLGGCPTGDAKVTSGGNLKARWVVHAVGPIYRGGTKGEAEKLASAYRRSLEEAEKAGARSVAFPSLSTGAYGYPIEEAARVALGAVIGYLSGDTKIETVRFVLFGRADYEVYETALQKSN